MRSNPLLGLILRDERLTRGLGDAEARILVEWLVERAEGWFEQHVLEEARVLVAVLCRKGRGIARFVWLWCQQGAWGSAAQLAASEGFAWPLPAPQVDPCELMHDILSWESRELEEAEADRPRSRSGP